MSSRSIISIADASDPIHLLTLPFLLPTGIRHLVSRLYSLPNGLW